MTNISKYITNTFRAKKDLQAKNNPQVLCSSSRAERDIAVISTARDSQPRLADDGDAHFVLGYN